MMTNAFTPIRVAQLASLTFGTRCATPIEADVVLWEYTAFPVCGVGEWVRQLCAFGWE